MNAFVAKTDLAYEAPVGFSDAQAGRGSASDRGLMAWMAAAVQWVAEMPRRRAVLNELSALSDYELADIGLVRDDLPRVFDSRFTSGRHAG